MLFRKYKILLLAVSISLLTPKYTTESHDENIVFNPIYFPRAVAIIITIINPINDTTGTTNPIMDIAKYITSHHIALLLFLT
jgi:hypothetical protein